MIISKEEFHNSYNIRFWSLLVLNSYIFFRSDKCNSILIFLYKILKIFWYFLVHIGNFKKYVLIHMGNSISLAMILYGIAYWVKKKTKKKVLRENTNKQNKNSYIDVNFAVNVIYIIVVLRVSYKGLVISPLSQYLF